MRQVFRGTRWELVVKNPPNCPVAISIQGENYTHPIDNRQNQQNFFWFLKTICQPREQLFLWLTYSKAFPTNTRLYRSGCNITPFCPSCLEEPEKHLNVLRNCKQTKEIWFALNHSQYFFTKPYHEWLDTNCKNKTKFLLTIHWQTIIVYTIRIIWLSSNNFFFKIDLSQPIIQGTWQFLKFSNFGHPTIHEKNNILKNRSQNMQNFWSKPNIGWKNLNVDRSAKNNSRAARGVNRLDNGQWFLGFSKFIRTSHAELAETWYLYLSLEIASSLQIKKLNI